MNFFRSLTVLLVDDDPIARKLCRQYLLQNQDDTFNLIEARSGEEGLKISFQQQLDLIFLDFALRDLDGQKFLLELNGCGKKKIPPIILLVEQGYEFMAIEAMKAGVANYLVKGSINPDNLKAVIEQVLKQTNLQEQWQRRGDKLQLATEVSQMGIWDWNCVTDELEWSERLEGYYGLMPGTFAGNFCAWLERVHPEDRHLIEEAIALATATENHYTIEYRIIAEDGSLRWLCDRAQIFYDDFGRVKRVFGVVWEISKYKQTEEQFRQLADRVEQVLWLGNRADKQVIYVNQAYEKIWGRSCESLLGDRATWIESLHPQDRERILAAAEEKGVQGEYDEEYRIVRPDGSIRWIRDRAFPISDEQGEVRRFAGIAEDITKGKYSEEHFRGLADAIPQIVWTCKANGEADYVNQRWYDYTGLTAEQTMNYGWRSVLHPDDVERSAQLWQDCLQNGTLYQIEHRYRRDCDGMYRWHLVRGVPFKDEQGSIIKWFGTCTDIHHQKQLEIENAILLAREQAALDEAQKANRIKDDFLAVLSHELRSPLNPILGWASLLRSHQFDATILAQGLEVIERNAKLQTRLIDDLLDVARILRGKLNLQIFPVNLIFVINAALETVKDTAATKSIHIETNLAAVELISGDAARLQQVIWNLLSNAVKFTPDGGRVEIRLSSVTGRLSLAEDDKQRTNYAQITVTDTGKGISAEMLPHVFEHFWQAEKGSTQSQGGLGLGLAIARHIVELHGGSIEVASAGEGQGATFTIKLPLSQENLLLIKKEENHLARPNLKGICVLVVDDEPDTLEMLVCALEKYSAEVIAVSSAQEAFNALISFKPNILVSDIGMPQADGYELLSRIRTLPPSQGGQIPAIALTAYVREEDRKKTKLAGFQAHLAKPIEPRELAIAILETINNQ
jgi:PAS domain S-box-containing protein